MNNYLTKKNMENLTLDNVDDARKGQILAIKDSIVF